MSKRERGNGARKLAMMARSREGLAGILRAVFERKSGTLGGKKVTLFSKHAWERHRTQRGERGHARTLPESRGSA